MQLHLRFIETAKRHGNKLAFIDRSADKQVTYRQALIGSLLLWRHFKKLDERYIGILMPNSAGCGISVLAVLMAGKIPVMINYATGAEQNIKFARRKCGFKTVLTSGVFLEKIQCPKSDGMVFVDTIAKGAGVFEKLRAAIMSMMPTSQLRRKVHAGSDDDTLLILFTSGSEKEPKAVQLSHRNIASNNDACTELYACKSEDIMLSVLPMFHVFGQSITFWLPICMGMTIVTYANPLDFKTIARIIRDDHPTIIVATPFFLAGFVRQSKPGDFSSIRFAIAGADKLPDWLREEYTNKHQVELFEGYGATETSPVITANSPGFNKPGSIGRPLPGVQVKIVDIDSGRLLGQGQEGKILVKGELVMKGYLGDLEETALRIEDGWYETGDMGLEDEEGYYWHRGRLKRFIKIGGEMVSLVQVEAVLENILPASCECCAVEIPDKRKGAIVGVAISEAIDETAVRNAISDLLPAIAMPRHFLVMEELPKMGSGKVDFRTTQTLFQEKLNG
ncbi:MAG: AMP-binding protein [Acidiferrobacterales bacterium]